MLSRGARHPDRLVAGHGGAVVAPHRMEQVGSMVDLEQSIEIKSADASFALDRDGRIVSWNAAAESLAGVWRGDAIGRRCYEIFSATDPKTGNVVCGTGCAHLALLTGEPVAAQGLNVAVGQGMSFRATCSVNILEGIAAARALVTVQKSDSGQHLAVARAAAQPSRTGSDADPSPKASLSVRMLGTVEVLVNGVPPKPSRFWRPKARQLLVYLVTRRARAAYRETLMELLWPDASAAAARQNLRVLVHGLRQVIRDQDRRGPPAPFILGDASVLALGLDVGVWTDAEAFSASVAEAHALADRGLTKPALEEYNRALALYRGDFLAHEWDAQWCIVEREHLREQYLDALQAVAELWAERGDFRRALSASQRLVEAEPTWEAGWRSLVSLCWRAGQQDRAIRAYEQCRRALLRELDVEPSPETRRLYQSIIDGSQPGRAVHAPAVGTR
ncbi:MAG: PAS domain-containing protein [Chloroflexi bacterium]|nr:PAS domain-containing protein [Chloroflexota bacterium]